MMTVIQLRTSPLVLSLHLLDGILLVLYGVRHALDIHLPLP